MSDTPGESSAAGKLRIVVLISGGGSTLANLLNRIDAGTLDRVVIVGVVSSRARAGGVEIARNAGLPCEVIEAARYPGEDEYSAALTAAVDKFQPGLVVMGGFLRRWVFPLDRYAGRVLNIHPALLPAFGGIGMYGMRVHEAVLASGATESGCTVHLVDHEYDHGPIVAQRRLRIAPDETPESLARRVAELERSLYPAVLETAAREGQSVLQMLVRTPLC